MKTPTILLTALLGILLTVQCAPEPVPAGPATDERTCQTEYSNLTIEDFRYPDSGEAEESINPELSYSYEIIKIWSDGEEEKETITDGAEIIFSTEDETLALNPETGAVVLPGSSYAGDMSFMVTVTVALPDGTEATKTAGLLVKGLEDFVSGVSTVQLPIELGPHLASFPSNYIPEVTYTSISKDGRPTKTNDYPYNAKAGIRDDKQYEYETVPASGSDIPFKGGQLASITEWASGKRDTVILAEPTLSTEADYRFVQEPLYHAETHSEEDESLKPASFVDNNIWHIQQLGAQRMDNIHHTFTATVDGHQTSVTVCQHNNFTISTDLIDRFCIIKQVHEAYNTRFHYNLPDYEDYRPGGKYYGTDSKWAASWFGSGEARHKAYFDGSDTRNLHRGENANRTIQLYIYNYCETMGLWQRTYLSGATATEAGRYYYPTEDPRKKHWQSNWFDNALATITAEADIPMKDGSTRHICHVWKWTRHPQWERVYTVFIPEVKDAVSDFAWTVTLDINLDESLGRVIWENPDYSLLHTSIQVMDYMETFEEFCKSQGITGPFERPDYSGVNIKPVSPIEHGLYDWEVTADIADGLTREEYMNTPYDQLPGR